MDSYGYGPESLIRQFEEENPEWAVEANQQTGGQAQTTTGRRWKEGPQRQDREPEKAQTDDMDFSQEEEESVHSLDQDEEMDNLEEGADNGQTMTSEVEMEESEELTLSTVGHHREKEWTVQSPLRCVISGRTRSCSRKHT